MKITARVSGEAARRLRALASADGVGVSTLLRVAVDAYLESRKAEIPPPVPDPRQRRIMFGAPQIRRRKRTDGG